MENGNRTRMEHIFRLQRLHKRQIQGSQYGDAGRGDAGDFFKTDAFVAQLRMGELFFRRHVLAQMGNCVREGRLLRKQQQQDQKAME